MRFNHGFKLRQHLDNHFGQHLPSENSKRTAYLSFSEFQQSKKAVLRGKYDQNKNVNLDAEVIPYNKESTLCVVCRQRVEIEQRDDDLVFVEGKNVNVEGKNCIAHINCF